MESLRDNDEAKQQTDFFLTKFIKPLVSCEKLIDKGSNERFP